jgi:hypothetical protein
MFQADPKTSIFFIGEFLANSLLIPVLKVNLVYLNNKNLIIPIKNSQIIFFTGTGTKTLFSTNKKNVKKSVIVLSTRYKRRKIKYKSVYVPGN